MNDIDNLTNGEIIIIDDGFGMDIDIINNIWMEPGTNNKEEKNSENFISDCNRRPIGEKGIGRFGVHKLGNKIELITKKANSKEVVLSIDWSEFSGDEYLSDKLITLKERKASFFIGEEKGTYIRVTNLRKEWSKRDFRELYRSIFALTSPFETRDNFNIEIETNLEDWKEGLLSLETLKRYALWYFECKASEVEDENGNKISKVTNFKYKFQPYRYMERAEAREVTEVDEYIAKNPFIRREIEKEKQEKNRDKFEDIPFDGIKEIDIKGYIFDFDKTTLDLSNISDRSGLKSFVKENGGVRVYRDGMRIYDYGEEGNDWLGMDASRINAPTSKIGNRNIISSVFLDGKNSSGLVEKTNREGFIEDKIYYNFRDIVINIINKVNFLKNEDKDKFRTQYAKEQDSDRDTLAIIEESKEKLTKYIPDEKKRDEVIHLIEKVEENYNSMKDIVLKSSGAGLAYSLVIHEIEKIVHSLNKTIKSKNFDDIEKIAISLSTIIEGVAKFLENDKQKNTLVNELIEMCMIYFEARFEDHKIKLIDKTNDKKFYINCFPKLTNQVLMNLFDNSIYWLDYKKMIKDRKILIDVFEKENSIELIIADNGLGFSISEDIAKLPFKTTKNEFGKGLGLYFSNEIMKQNLGALKIITNKEYKIKNLNLEEDFIDGATIALEFKKGELK